MWFQLITLMTFFLLAGCGKPDPNAYQQDPIYQDYQAELAKAISARTEAESQIKEHEAALAKAVPQTGQRRFPQKWLDSAREAYTKSNQMVRYWEIKIQTRKSEAQKNYLIAFSKKTPWPDPKEFEQYNKMKEAHQKSRSWDVKGRLRDHKSTLPVESSIISPEVAPNNNTGSEH